MESHTSTAAQVEDQAEIRRQIAALQAKLVPNISTPPKRKQARVFAKGSPSPKKRKLEHAKPLPARAPAPKPLSRVAPPAPPLQPSNLVSNLASLHSRSKQPTAEPVVRSVAFTEPPPASANQQERDDRLAIVEKLVPGPQDHKPPIDDPHFERFEPNSGIHLSSRKLAHADLQEHLRGRYYLSPSLMYSVVRPLPSNQAYDVPVPGDWLTIAVIAERGSIKLTSANNHDDEDVKSTTTKGKQKIDKKPHSSGGKKYMSIKLVDFGTTTRGAKAQVRGDALLTLLLFEADSYSYIEDENRPSWSKAEKVKVYKGGSGGAFEACMKLHEGAVIAILNPKILKPYQRNATALHPTNNILAITPTSAQSIAIIGHARDLGTCAAVKRDGKPCGSWCDKRVSECCEYHVENAVKRNRAGRPEFSIGTSGMTKSARVAFDPDRKWGLLPNSQKSGSGEGGGSTYVVPGFCPISASGGPENVAEKIGRGREERVRRRREERKVEEEMLNRLLGSGDQNGSAAVRKAREVMRLLKGEDPVADKPPLNGKEGEGRKSAYSAETIRRLGFDPTGKSGDVGDAAVKRKMEALESLQSNRPVPIELGRRPGKRMNCVVGPGREERVVAALESSDDDLEVEPPVIDTTQQ